MTDRKTTKQDFVDGLKNKHNLTMEEFTQNYKYAGGNFGSHYNYYNKYMNFEMPMTEFECVCGHKIERNCYMYNKDNDHCVVVGCECINRFIPKEIRSRTCEICDEPHRNRITNRCNKCKVKKCFKCNGQLPTQLMKKYPSAIKLACKDCFVWNGR